jgi:hypothetical protein
MDLVEDELINFENFKLLLVMFVVRRISVVNW